MFRMYLRGFVLKFSQHGRYADLLLGLVALFAGLWFGNEWIVASGVLAIFTYAIDLNGMIQRRVMSLALSKVKKR